MVVLHEPFSVLKTQAKDPAVQLRRFVICEWDMSRRNVLRYYYLYVFSIIKCLSSIKKQCHIHGSGLGGEYNTRL